MKFITPLLLLILWSCTQNSKTDDTVTSSGSSELTKLFADVDRYTFDPEDSLYRSLHPHGAWSQNTPAAKKVRAEGLQKFRKTLESIADADLSEQEKISKAIMLISLDDQIDYINFNRMMVPINAEGGFYNQLSYTLARLPFKEAKDYYDYLHWLPNYEKALQENLAWMKMGIEQGIVAPKVVVKNNLELIKPWLVDNYQQSAFYAPLTKMPESVNETDRKAISQESERVIGSLLATYKNINQFLATEYMSAAKEEPGVSLIPTGKEFYENRVRHFSTLNLTPDSVHNLGLMEVARIRASMDKIIRELNFKGSFAEFLAYLRSNEQFYAKTPQELLNYAAWLSKKAEGQLPKYFNTLYSLPFIVEPVPASIAPTYTGGRYVGGSWESKQAGIYWVNTYNLKSRTLYTIPALTLHEAVPGHHLQGAFAAEIKGLPEFRNRYYISAFGEGWGLYSEYLGEEMGMYTTPYELFGRYTYEMWRACRLVVDTGIHYKGWSREQALKYLSENTALSIHEVTTEIDRYIGWPGQALSYKIGEIEIKYLRKKAEDALGKKFHIGDFHEAILKNGSVPLTVMEGQIDEYIKKALEKPESK